MENNLSPQLRSAKPSEYGSGLWTHRFLPFQCVVQVKLLNHGDLIRNRISLDTYLVSVYDLILSDIVHLWNSGLQSMNLSFLP